MKVLVLEDAWRASDEVADRLSAAGMEVVRCHEPDQPPFPCSGMPGGAGCPMEHQAIDVAISVRQGDGAPTVSEDGVRCALRHHVPVVAAGVSEGAAWLPLVTVVERDTARAVEAVQEAADAPLRRHTERATAELREVLVRKGVDASRAEATVERRVGGLRVTLRPGTDLSTPVAQAAAVRVAAALRAIDDKSSAVDVTVAPAGDLVGASS